MANATSDILAYVKRAPYAQSVGKSGNAIHYTSTDFRKEDKERIQSKIKAYLAKRVNLAACYFEFGPDADPDDIHDSETFLRVDIPMSAVRNSSVASVAKNGAASILVTFNTITAKGLEKVQAKMSADDFETWAKKIGVGSELQNVWHSLMKGAKATFYTRPTPISVREI